jgi:hypothetical protein
MKNKLLLLLFLITNLIAAQKANGVKINTVANSEYEKSRKVFKGKILEENFIQIRELIAKELKTEIPKDKTILINYFQFGKNCIDYGFPNEEKDFEDTIKNCIRLSKDICQKNNAIDFFVYSKNALLKNALEKQENFILDSGFFAKNIFTLQENCKAFLILKPNGDFIKYYGEDYYSEVEKYLK